MNKYKKLADAFGGMIPQSKAALYQGVVTAVDGVTCSVQIDDIIIEDIRLRASTKAKSNQMLITPKVGTVAIVGSLTGNFNEMVLLSCDEIDSILVNGGALGGLIKIEELKSQLAKITARIDGIISAINNGIPTPGTDGGAALLTTIKTGLATIQDKESFSAIEDTKIKH